MTSETVVFGSGITVLSSGPSSTNVVKRIYVQPLASNVHRMSFQTAAGATIKSIAAPGSSANAIFDDFDLIASGDDPYEASEYAVAGTAGEGCVVTYWLA
jgi:hypothetical protein